MKGIILAGGSGTRLYPLTASVSKQLMPVYDKPMIYYPLSTLMEAGINEVLIITTPRDQDAFQELLGDGSQLGCKFQYAVQEFPTGLADAFIIGEDFIGSDSVCLILGDNIFYGSSFTDELGFDKKNFKGAKIFGYQVSDPTAYGVVEINVYGKAISIEEKPKLPKSNLSVPGLYFYDNKVVEIAKKIKPSDRGELEITDINIEYMKMYELDVVVLDRGVAWLDTGTIDSLMQASQFVQVIEERQGLKIGCIEEAALKNGWIRHSELESLSDKYRKSAYGQYLRKLYYSAYNAEALKV
jgi:glucose-1-phosphate thymidylyltransferase